MRNRDQLLAQVLSPSLSLSLSLFLTLFLFPHVSLFFLFVCFLQGSSKYPAAYRENNIREMLVLEYVENFRVQYVQLFPDRPPLFLCPKNEAGVQVIIGVAWMIALLILPLTLLSLPLSVARFPEICLHDD
ncbi:MAG: hypothetical protein ACK4RF_13040, partial [Cyclobacteriaceae bacterium]